MAASATELDALGLAVEFDSGSVRRIGSGARRSAEACGLRIECRARVFESAFGAFDGSLELCGPARDGFRSPCCRVAERSGNRFDAFAFGGQACRDGFTAHFGAGPCFVESRDLVFQNRFERAQTGERAIEAGVQRVEFAAHRAAKPGRCT